MSRQVTQPPGAHDGFDEDLEAPDLQVEPVAIPSEPAEAPAADAGRHGRVRPRVVEAVAVIGGYLLVAIAITWPLVLHMGTRFPGGGTYLDPTGYYNDVWYLSTHGFKLFGSAVQTGIDAPFGRPIIPSAYLEQIVSYGPAVMIARIWTVAAGLSVVALFALVSSAASMYLLVRFLGAGRIAAAWSGIALMLSPYLLNRVPLHLPLSNLACFPLLLIACIRWMEKPGLRRSGWIALAIALAWLSDPYFGFMAMVIAAVCAIVALVGMARAGGWRIGARRLGELVAAVVVLVCVPLLMLLITSGKNVQDSFSRNADQLALFGAHVTDYIWPSQQSQLMGWLFGSAWSGTGPPAGVGSGSETALFFGWSTIALGIAWIVIARRHWAKLPSRLRTTSVLAAPLLAVLVLFSFSSPYNVGPVGIPMPSRAIFAVVPFLRAYARFGAPAMVVVVMIAALSIDWVVRRMTRTKALALGALCIAITVIELPISLPIPSGPPLVVNGPDSAPASTFAVWKWLASQKPDGILIDLPTSSIEPQPLQGFMDRIWMYGQSIHGWPIANGQLEEQTVATAFGRLIGDPRFRFAAANLATVGVRTVVVHPWAFRQAKRVPPNTAHPPSGFALVRRYSDGTAVWRVTAAPRPGVAFPEVGFLDTNADSSMPFMMNKSSGTMALWTPHAGTYSLGMRLTSRRGVTAIHVDFGDGQTVQFLVRPGSPQTFRAVVRLSAGTTIARVWRTRASGTGHGAVTRSSQWLFLT
jgi:hypothetical protein